MKRKQALYSALALLLVGTSATGLLFSGTDSIALQNPLLRNYFRQLYLDSSSFTFVNRTDPHSAEAQFFERQIDLLAADFLKRLAAKLRALSIHFYEARKSRGEMLNSAPDAGRRVMLQNQLKFSLKSLAQEANDLRKTLSLILVGLDHKADRKPLTKNWGPLGTVTALSPTPTDSPQARSFSGHAHPAAGATSSSFYRLGLLG